MKKESLEAFETIPFPERGDLKFIDQLRNPPEPEFSDAPVGQFSRGIFIPENLPIPATATVSLKKVLTKRNIRLSPEGIPFVFKTEKTFEYEEFLLEITPEKVIISASESEGVRGAIYAFEELILLHDSEEVCVVKKHMKPYIKRRITRCFFSPNSRPPLRLDELEDDLDYYPEGFLDQLAHSRLNGVWISVYLSDMPCSLFPARGKNAARKLIKLQKIVDKCAAYGIKCYLFMAEPRRFGNTWKAMTLDDREKHPEMAGHQNVDSACFCTSSRAGQAYLDETMSYIFSHVHGLGGVINIMCQESSMPCALYQLYPHTSPCNCPHCSKRSIEELFAEIAVIMRDAMHRYQPEAEFIGWFYASWYMPNEPENALLLKVAENWPENMTIMRNCETGGQSEQLGKKRIVEDYSLSYAALSEPFLKLAEKAVKPGAKIQTGCSHEDASVPYIPVPGNLYRIYDGLRKTRCESVMQCWYFGNWPGLMNRAAGRLSFLPFPATEIDFLLELARLEWGAKAEKVAECWHLFSKSYRNFPENINFKWFGPMHHSLVFPWYLFPADLPMAPTYTQRFPKNSGDRIGECIGYKHDFNEVLTLLNKMDKLWQQGLQKMSGIAETIIQCKEYALAEAIGLQIASTKRLFKFYMLRERMIFHKKDLREQMKMLVKQEINATLRMKELCEDDARLGYHSEVESYLLFPKKLESRAGLLQELLEDDFERFDFNAPEILRYTGELRGSEYFRAAPSKNEAAWFDLETMKFAIYRRGKELCFHFRNLSQNVHLEFEPGRLCQIINTKLMLDGWGHESNFTRGIALEKSADNAILKFDLTEFAGFRQGSNVPLRFNLSCNNTALKTRNPYPERLYLGTSNPADLLFLYLE